MTKQAACLVCRRSKIKCHYSPHHGRCKRCVQLDCECVRPDFHAGRQKGIKNKRVGLDKVLFQIEQALGRKKAGRHGVEDDKVVRRLRELLSQVTEDGIEDALTGDLSSQVSTNEVEQSNDTDKDGAASVSDFEAHADESIAVRDAENPLQLLARASHFRPSLQTTDKENTRPEQGTREPSTLQVFFAPLKVHLDVGEDVDPIILGLVTETEAESLFSFFHGNLAHTRWGLDPRIYNLAFTRSRSSFLTTSIMAASALFLHDSALSRRLSNHTSKLAKHVVMHGYRSVEIVLAFMVNVPWMFPGQLSTDDETCRYISMATTIAIDLLIHKVLISQEMLGPGPRLELPRGECLDPKAALTIDGHPDVDPRSERGMLLLRGRERCWISLFVLERGMSLARGRPFIVPVTRSLRVCDNWHRSPLANPHDGHVVSMAVLRRNLDELFNTIRAMCDGSQTIISNGSLIAESIQSAIESFFERWYTEWGVSIGIGPECRLPPYVEILVTHTRLSTYGSVINHPTAPVEVRQFFRTAGLSAALNVMSVAIQGEHQLKSMPNNTAIMISFAACFALALSAYATDGSALAPSVKKLVDETAGVLERIGTVTAHRNGLSVLYGKYLRQIARRGSTTGSPVRQAAAAASARPEAANPSASEMNMATTTSKSTQHNCFMDNQLLWPEAVQFSTMSDDQIIQMLNQPGNELDPSFDGLSWDDMNNFDWLN